MSRIGRLPITVPPGVDITVDGTHVSVKGPKGDLSRDIAPQLTIDTSKFGVGVAVDQIVRYLENKGFLHQADPAL